MTDTEPADSTRSNVSVARRTSSWRIDAAVIGTPAAVVAILVPVIPIGAIIWISYRIWVAIHGTSIGRRALRWKLQHHNTRPPHAAGLAWLTYATAPYAAAVTVTGVVIHTAQPASWGWLWWAPAAATAGFATFATITYLLWSTRHNTNSPRIDRWAHLEAVHTTNTR